MLEYAVFMVPVGKCLYYLSVCCHTCVAIGLRCSTVRCLEFAVVSRWFCGDVFPGHASATQEPSAGPEGADE